MFVIASTCAGADPVLPVTPVVPTVDPVLSPSELVDGSSALRSGVSDEVPVELPSPPPIADAISESGDKAEVYALSTSRLRAPKTGRR